MNNQNIENLISIADHLKEIDKAYQNIFENNKSYSIRVEIARLLFSMSLSKMVKRLTKLTKILVKE